MSRTGLVDSSTIAVAIGASKNSVQHIVQSGLVRPVVPAKRRGISALFSEADARRVALAIQLLQWSVPHEIVADINASIMLDHYFNGSSDEDSSAVLLVERGGAWRIVGLNGLLPTAGMVASCVIPLHPIMRIQCDVPMACERCGK
jgi:hypothetical protein